MSGYPTSPPPPLEERPLDFPPFTERTLPNGLRLIVVEQHDLPVDRARKRELLSHLIREHNWFQVLVFTRTKHGANRLSEQLAKDGIPALAIHGNKSQGARTRALRDFKNGQVRVLVATDIAARGLDIDQLAHVVNFDLPNVPEDYVHRVGRTGRAGLEGEAVSLVAPEEKPLLADIERLLKRALPRTAVEGFEVDARAASDRTPGGSPRRNGGQRPNPRSGDGKRPGQAAPSGPAKPAGTKKPRRRRRRARAAAAGGTA